MYRSIIAGLFLSVAFLVACGGGEKEAAAQEVVVYTALDREFSEPILKQFTEETGIVVKPVYDTEAVKTTGLVNRLIAEKARPTCDVFWNNEIVRSIQLKREGVTEAYRSPSAEKIPPELKDPEGHWTGFATRARVICANTELLPTEADRPQNVSDLIRKQWQGKAAFAKPLFGTTATHAAVIWAEQGEEVFRAFWSTAMENAVMVAGNAQARDAAADGELPWCLTDTDDAYGALLDGKPVEIIYPDDGANEEGIILIPNTVVLIKNAPHPEAARALIDYLLSPEVEAKLAQSRSAQIPVRDGIAPPEGLKSLEGRHIRDIDWEAVADALEPSQAALAEMLANQ
ncbi:extracellular solute-binding protein [bacterium]|nr:extracellular solute-binding protein [bacterium]